VVALLAATAIAFATTERLKLKQAPFDVFPITKVFSPLHGFARIALRLRRPHRLTVQIINSSQRTVASLARNKRFGAGTVAFHWWGRNVPDGSYEPRITLDDGRVYTLPNPIRVDTVAPRVSLVSYRPHVLRRRRKTRVHVAYRVSEPAHVILYVNGRDLLFGGAKALRSKVDWYAKRNGKRLPRGRYRLQLAAVDLAGNRSARTRTYIVRIR
jgi:hypothetical protein